VHLDEHAEPGRVAQGLVERPVGDEHAELREGEIKLDAAGAEPAELLELAAAEPVRLPDRRVERDVDSRERDELVARAHERLGRRLAGPWSREGQDGRRAAVRRGDGGGDDVRERMRVRVDAAREDDAAARVQVSRRRRRLERGDPSIVDDDVRFARALGEDDQASDDPHL